MSDVLHISACYTKLCRGSTDQHWPLSTLLMPSDSTSFLKGGVSKRTSLSMSSKTSKAEGKKKTCIEKKRNSVRFFAGDKRPRLSNSRSSDDHENAIEEDDTDENWEDEKDETPASISCLSQLSLLVETQKLGLTASAESEPLMQMSESRKKMLENELDETIRRSILLDRKFKKPYMSGAFHDTFNSNYPRW